MTLVMVPFVGSNQDPLHLNPRMVDSIQVIHKGGRKPKEVAITMRNGTTFRLGELDERGADRIVNWFYAHHRGK